MSTKKTIGMVVLLCLSGVLRGNAEESVVSNATPAESIKIGYEMNEAGLASIGIFNKEDRLIRHLMTGEKKEMGKHEALWNGRDDDGKVVAPGTYEYRGAANNVGIDWVEHKGNSGNPPWGKTAVRAGSWVSVDICGDGVVGLNSSAEGDGTIQRYDRNGQVVWTANSPPVHAENSLIASDDKYVYVATVSDQMVDSSGKRLISELLWRLDVATGRPVPWPENEPLVRLTIPRVGHFSSQCFLGWNVDPIAAQLDLLEPFPDWGLYDLEAVNGKIYLPLHKEKKIKVLDRETARELTVFQCAETPCGIAVYPNGDMLVATASTVEKYSPDGRRIGVVISGLEHARDVDIDKEGNIYVAELGEARCVKKFSPEGELMTTIGRRSGKDNPLAIEPSRHEDFYLPLSIAVNREKRLYVADYIKGCIAVIDAKGSFLDDIASYGRYSMPGQPIYFRDQTELLLYTATAQERNPWCLSRYQIDETKKDWRRTHCWISTCSFMDANDYMRGLKIRKLGDRIFIFAREGTVSIWEIKGERIVLCAAFLLPEAGYVWDAPLRKDFEELGLLWDKDMRKGTNDRHLRKGHPRCGFIWIDHNRDGRAQKDEIVENQTNDFNDYKINDVDDEGNLYVQEFVTPSGKNDTKLWRFDIQGFDKAGNPLYNWRDKTKVLFMSEHPEDFTSAGPEHTPYKVDKKGNVYFSMQKGNNCFPEAVQLLSFNKDGGLRWKFGRKAVGNRDQPGEYNAVCSFYGVVDDYLFVPDYEGTVDVLTTDGLYLNRLLNSAYTGEVGPYTSFGENFFGDVYKDPRTGHVFMSNCSYGGAQPVYKVTGLDKVRRFIGKVEVSADMVKGLKDATVAQLEIPVHKNGEVYRLKQAISIDGDFKDWPLGQMKPQETAFPDDDKYNAKLYAGFDEQNLYFAVAVSEPSPGINTTKALSGGLWNGDCLEFLFSAGKGQRIPGSDWLTDDLMISMAADGCNVPRKFGAPQDGGKGAVAQSDKVEVCGPGVEGVHVPEGSLVSCCIWENGKGYNLELKIPWKSLDYSAPKVGENLLWEWDIMCGAGEGRSGLKMYWTKPHVGGDNYHSRQNWEKVSVVNLENANELALVALSKEPAFEVGIQDWPKERQITIRDDEETSAIYNMDLYAGYTKDNLLLRFEVRDPDPAINTATLSMWWETGDVIDLYFNSRRVCIPATPDTKQANFVADGLAPIKESQIKVKVYDNKKGYTLLLKLPWEAIGGLKNAREGMKFNMSMTWSDPTGGSVWRRIFWAGKTTADSGVLKITGDK